MATIIYPTDATIYARLIGDGTLTEQFIGITPDTIFLISGSALATSSLSTSASYSTYAVTASLLLGSVQSASFATLALTSTSASFATTASNVVTASNALTATSASYASTVTSASFASTAISASYASTVTSASFASTIAQDNSVNSVTASYISGTMAVYVPTPTAANQAASKQYVDNINPQSLDLYFRASGSDVPQYDQMLTLATPLNGLTSDVVMNNVSASQYFANFISPQLNITNIAQGTFNVHFHCYRVGGASANSIQPELYIRSASNEAIQLGSTQAVTITTTTTDSFTVPIITTSSIVTNLTDRLVCKFKCINGTSTPNIHLIVDAGTAAGVNVPVPSTAFVLRGGDTMTGNLTVPQVIGTASYANYAPNIDSVSTITFNTTMSANASSADHFVITATGSFLLNTASNATNGQKSIYEFIQDTSGSRTMTLGTGWNTGSTLTNVQLNQTASKRDFMTSYYNSTSNAHYVLGFVTGY